MKKLLLAVMLAFVVFAAGPVLAQGYTTPANPQSNAGGGTTSPLNQGVNSYNYVWNGSAWVQATSATGGGAVTGAAGSFLDGWNTDWGVISPCSPATTGTGGSWTECALERGILNTLLGIQTNQGNATTVNQGTSPWIAQAAPTSNITRGLISSAMTATTSTAVTGMGVQGAGIRNYILTANCWNSAATGTGVDLQDGNGGTVFFTMSAGASYLGSSVISFPSPGLQQPTANTALYAVDETTGAAVKCSFAGYSGP